MKRERLNTGDHIQLHGVKDGVAYGTAHSEEGSFPFSCGVDEGSSSSAHALEKCPGAPEDSNLYHILPSKGGPAMVNSRSYCEGYNRIFGKTKPGSN